MEKARGHLAEDAVWLQQSTVGVAGCARLQDLAADLGVTYVDAPVLGTRKPAADGALVVVASGPDSARPILTPVFDAIGRRTLWVGEAGNGSRLKLVVNAWVATILEGVAESLALARDLGLEPELFLEAVGGGADGRAVHPAQGQEHAHRAARAGVRPRRRTQGRRPHPRGGGGTGTELGLMPGVRAHLARAVEAGHGELDMAATYLEH